MKIIFIHTLFGIIAFLSVITGVEAQTTRLAAASIPFEFQVGSKTLPAGTYIFERPGSQSDSSALIVRDARYNHVASSLLSYDDLSYKGSTDQPTLLFADIGSIKVFAYLLDPQDGYFGRAGSASWRQKKVWRERGVTAITLRQVTAAK